MKIIIFKASIEKQTYRSEQCLTHRKNSKDYGETLKAALQRLDSYLSDYQCFFKNKTKKLFDKAEKYSKGIFLSRERNIEKICESHHDLDYYRMQHFISDSNWDARAVVDKAAQETSHALPKRKLTGLIIDETGTVKAEIPFHDELTPKRDNSNPESILNERYANEEKEEIDHPDSNLDAWTVLKLSGKTSPGNVSEANQNFKCEELEFDGGEQLSLL